MTRAFMAALVVAFVVLSVLADSGATQGIVSGTVAEFEAGEWIAVANETTDPMGFRIALRETTSYEGNPAAIKAGERVTVWYRSVGERRPVADKVRVLPDAAAPSALRVRGPMNLRHQRLNHLLCGERQTIGG